MYERQKRRDIEKERAGEDTTLHIKAAKISLEERRTTQKIDTHRYRNQPNVWNKLTNNSSNGSVNDFKKTIRNEQKKKNWKK